MKTKISQAAIAGYLAGRYSRVDGFLHLAEGEESQAFAADADGCAIVVRVGPKRAGFDKDRLAAASFPLLPVPRILSIEPFADAWVCVSERAPGNTLQSLGTGAAHFGEAVVHAMDALAASDVSFVTGYGPFDAAGRGAFATWQDFVAAVEGPAELVALVRQHAYGTQHRLVHGDFGSNNVLAAGQAVTAVIDWSEAMAGDPLYDLANLFFWRSWLDCMEAQCRYMERLHPSRLTNRPLLLRYQLRIGLQVLTEAQRDGDPRLEEWAHNRCRAIAMELAA